MKLTRLFKLPVLLLTLLSIFTLSPLSAAEVITEYQLKAAFLYNFASFTQWPDEHELYRLCVIGVNPFDDNLETISRKKLYGKPIKIISDVQPGNIKDCQIIFIAKSAEKQLARVLSTVANQPVLTVSDIEDSAVQGAMFSLITIKNKVTFESNFTSIENSHLSISAKLLRLAKKMHKNATNKN